jgi:hypothetical protein
LQSSENFAFSSTPGGLMGIVSGGTYDCGH